MCEIDYTLRCPFCALAEQPGHFISFYVACRICLTRDKAVHAEQSPRCPAGGRSPRPAAAARCSQSPFFSGVFHLAFPAAFAGQRLGRTGSRARTGREVAVPARPRPRGERGAAGAPAPVLPPSPSRSGKRSECGSAPAEAPHLLLSVPAVNAQRLVTGFCPFWVTAGEMRSASGTIKPHSCRRATGERAGSAHPPAAPTLPACVAG